MSLTATWKEKFKIPPHHTLEEALKSQMINEIEYQGWASRHYSLPVMKDEFFEKHPLDTKFLNKIKQQNKVTPSAIPCFEWNDILYVACLEPQKMDINQKTVFFITSLKTMESLWEKIQSSSQEKTNPKEQTPSLSKINKSDASLQQEKTLTIKKEPENKRSEKTDKEKTLNVKKQATVQKIENDVIEFEFIHPLKIFIFALSDFFTSLMNFIIAADQKKAKKQLKSKSITVSKSKKTKKKLRKTTVQTIIPKSVTPEIEEKHITLSRIQKADLEQSTSQAITENQKTSGKKENPESNPSNEDPPKIIPMENSSIDESSSKEEMPLSTGMEEENTPDSNKSSVKEEMPQPVSLLDMEEEPPSPEDPGKPSLKSEKKDPSTPNLKIEEEASEDPSSALNEDHSYHEDHDKTGSHSSGSFVILEQKKAGSMDQLSPLRRTLEETKHYVNSYILFEKEKDLFVPCKWSSDLQKANKKVPGNIKKPSIFRIVYTSKQPYFGHLAPILTNNSFFNEWGFESLPKNVILIPFLDAEKKNVLGVYLGISETRTLPIKCLHAVEQIVQPLSSYYEDGGLLKNTKLKTI